MNRTKNIHLIQEKLIKKYYWYKINTKSNKNFHYTKYLNNFQLSNILSTHGNTCIYQIDSDGVEHYYYE